MMARDWQRDTFDAVSRFGPPVEVLLGEDARI
jgi:hypothetical protein